MNLNCEIVMGRTLFQLRGLKSVVYRKFFYGKTFIEASRWALPAVAQKLFNFSALRGGKGAAEAGAFQGRGGGGKAQRLAQLLLFP